MCQGVGRAPGERGGEPLRHQAPVPALLQEVLRQGGLGDAHADPAQDHPRRGHRQEHAQRPRLIRVLSFVNK